jgi:hypothetical protein
LKGPVEFKADTGEVKPDPDGLSARYVPPPPDSKAWQAGPQVIEGGIVANEGVVVQDGRAALVPKLSLTAHITAQFGDRVGRAAVVIAKDRGPMLNGDAKLSRFEQGDKWQVVEHLSAFSSPSWSISKEQAHEGASSGSSPSSANLSSAATRPA